MDKSALNIMLKQRVERAAARVQAAVRKPVVAKAA